MANDGIEIVGDLDALITQIESGVAAQGWQQLCVAHGQKALAGIERWARPIEQGAPHLDDLDEPGPEDPPGGFKARLRALLSREEDV